MLSSHPLPTLPLSTPVPWISRTGKIRALVIGLVLISASILFWALTRTTVVNLADEAQLDASGLLQRWAEGGVIVMVRHAERCDSSPGRCLDDSTGITVAGSQAAQHVGEGLQQLGLGGADVLSSPKLRTRQTAHFLIGATVASENWLEDCDRGFAEQALDRKRSGHNLVLVTHSGCIDHFERDFQVDPADRRAAYASALFVSLDDHGHARILGRLNEPDWRRVLATTRR
ncbi:histidine phosphatase family protein [Pseudomonas sp. S75]|nr:MULTISPECIES: histidine phosphatase family protein [unclassified Pseudomonas]MBJ9977883.1 histidine phosphatase family protein [Pseudomonas sp. S30]MBK0155911.1 histidine phosphatase family protein [Pseudomonas sp. S75]